MEEQTIQGFPLSPPQVHLWRLKEACAFPWNVGLRAALEGPLEAAELEAALRAVVGEEEILRTGFAHLSGSSVGVQVIGEEPLFELETDTLSEPAGEAREACLHARFEALLARDFALESQPPSPALRVALVSLGDDRHELQLVQPALVSDVASLELLLRRLGATLAGETDATGADAVSSDEEQADERMQYADLAEWLLEMFEGEDAPEGLGFWRRVDLEAVRTTRLPLETETGEAFRPERVPVPLAPETLEALAAAGDEQVSRADRILAAWQHLIGRHTEREDTSVALASPGRTFEGLEEALGPFQRSLPLALAAGGGDTLEALAARAAAAREEAAEWHELWELERARSGAEPAFLPYAFEHFRAEPALRSGGLVLRVLERRGFCDRFRLKLVLDEAAAVPLTLWYDAAVLEGEAARLLADQLATLLADACRRPATPLGELSLTSDAERERLLTVLGHGAPSVTLPDVLAVPLEGELAHDAILAHAAATPEACAVQCADGELSYGELVQRASRLARHLSALGVARGERVGIAMGRSCEWPVAMLACLLSGAAYLPLPPGYPAERVGFMLADSGARVVLTRRADAAVSASLAASDADLRVVVVDELDLDEVDGSPPASPATESDPAYVIYTSGSTGKPKGVPIPHGHLARSTAARFAYYDRAPGRYLLLSSFAFDSSIVGVFWTLCAGGTLVLPAEGEETDLVALAGWIERAGVTHTLALPSLWAVLLEETPAERLRSLELVLVAGEACTRELVGRHLSKLPDCQLHNEYGPTEATVWCTAHDCRIASRRALVPIGRPIPGASTYVVDAALEPLPRGLAGELVVGGPCVAPGYLGRPELTAERFLPDRFEPDAASRGARIYRTGDLVRMLVDGTLEFLGRVDHQVKIRGFRVELGEIESVLAAVPGVKDVLVHARDDRSGSKELVAYVVRASGDGPGAEELRRHLAGPLPAYMIPAHLVFLEELPRLPNGKIDRARLPDPSQDDAAHAPYAAPQSPLELVLAELWADVLDVERVGLDDDFFLLGGHSIVATQLFARITDALEVRIALRTLFEARTVRRLAGEILADGAARPRIERAAELLAEALASDEEEPG